MSHRFAGSFRGLFVLMETSCMEEEIGSKLSFLASVKEAGLIVLAGLGL